MPATRNAALRAALTTETCIAEALTQRSRGLVTLFERLTQRVLDEASDIADARVRLDVLCRSLDSALMSGEAGDEGDLRALAIRTLGAFETGAGPRILVEGPLVTLDPEAGRVVSLALFDLASRSLQFGALGADEGRVALEWDLSADGLRLTWREFGVRPGTERLRHGAGSSLQALLADRFGTQLRQSETPFGMVAELPLPAWTLWESAGSTPRRVLVAATDATAAVTLSALLMASGGVFQIAVTRSPAEASAALAPAGSISRSSISRCRAAPAGAAAAGARAQGADSAPTPERATSSRCA